MATVIEDEDIEAIEFKTVKVNLGGLIWNKEIEDFQESVSFSAWTNDQAFGPEWVEVTLVPERVKGDWIEKAFRVMKIHVIGMRERAKLVVGE